MVFSQSKRATFEFAPQSPLAVFRRTTLLSVCVGPLIQTSALWLPSMQAAWRDGTAAIEVHEQAETLSALLSF